MHDFPTKFHESLSVTAYYIDSNWIREHKRILKIGFTRRNSLYETLKIDLNRFFLAIFNYSFTRTSTTIKKQKEYKYPRIPRVKILLNGSTKVSLAAFNHQFLVRVTITARHQNLVGFQVLKAASLKMTAFWDIADSSEVLTPPPWRWSQYEPLKYPSTLRRNIPEGCHLEHPLH